MRPTMPWALTEYIYPIKTTILYTYKTQNLSLPDLPHMRKEFKVNNNNERKLTLIGLTHVHAHTHIYTYT